MDPARAAWLLVCLPETRIAFSGETEESLACPWIGFLVLLKSGFGELMQTQANPYDTAISRLNTA